MGRPSPGSVGHRTVAGTKSLAGSGMAPRSDRRDASAVDERALGGPPTSGRGPGIPPVIPSEMGGRLPHQRDDRGRCRCGQDVGWEPPLRSRSRDNRGVVASVEAAAQTLVDGGCRCVEVAGEGRKESGACHCRRNHEMAAEDVASANVAA